MTKEVAYAGIGLVVCDKASGSEVAYLAGERACETYCGRCPSRLTPVGKDREVQLPLFGHKMEAVNHPVHYGGADSPYEHIKVVNAWGLNYELGNATKYICRAGKKDPAKAIEDLEKAVFYLNAEIYRRKRESHAG